jgi:hypothetical protein
MDFRLSRQIIDPEFTTLWVRILAFESDKAPAGRNLREKSFVIICSTRMGHRPDERAQKDKKQN